MIKKKKKLKNYFYYFITSKEYMPNFSITIEL